MRKTCSSSKTDSTRPLSSRASSSERPNGFSMITRTSASSRSARSLRPSASMMTGKNVGAVER